MSRLFNDGTNEYLENSNAVLASTPITLAVWFYSDDLTVNQGLLTITDGVANGVILEASGGAGGDPISALVIAGGVPGAALSTAGYSANTWHHACAVFASSTDRRAYIDGGNRGNNAANLTPAGLDRTTIAQLGNGSRYTSGRIAEAGVWSVALTDAEVAILGLGYSPLFVRPQSLVAYWSLIRDEDQDRVGGYDMAAFNTPSIAPHVPIRYPAAKMVGTLTVPFVAAAPFLTTYGGYSVPVG